MRVDVFCGGSDQPFVFEVNVEDAGRAVSSLRSGDVFKLEAKTEDIHTVTYFNPSCVDAIQLWGEK